MLCSMPWTITQGGCSLLSQSVGSGNYHHNTSQGGGGAMVVANPQHQQKQMRPQQGECGAHFISGCKQVGSEGGRMSRSRG